jgi:hypothetical protein
VTGYGARLHVLPAVERFSMKHKLAGAAITMLVAGLAAGCGGGDDNDTTAGAATTTTAAAPTKPLTKAEYIARADAACEAATKRIDAAGTKLQGSAKKPRKLTQAQIRAFLTQSTVPSYERMLSELRNLTPPTRDRPTIDSFVAELSTAIDALKSNPDTYAKLATNPFGNANTQAKAYGMKVCGS